MTQQRPRTGSTHHRTSRRSDSRSGNQSRPRPTPPPDPSLRVIGAPGTHVPAALAELSLDRTHARAYDRQRNRDRGDGSGSGRTRGPRTGGDLRHRDRRTDEHLRAKDPVGATVRRISEMVTDRALPQAPAVTDPHAPAPDAVILGNLRHRTPGDLLVPVLGVLVLTLVVSVLTPDTLGGALVSTVLVTAAWIMLLTRRQPVYRPTLLGLGGAGLTAALGVPAVPAVALGMIVWSLDTVRTYRRRHYPVLTPAARHQVRLGRDTAVPRSTRAPAEITRNWDRLAAGCITLDQANLGGGEATRIALGGLGEVRTQTRLTTGPKKLPAGSTLINGIEVLSDRAHRRTSADIDHLVLATDSTGQLAGTVMIDSKVWASPIELSTLALGAGGRTPYPMPDYRLDRPGRITMLNRNSPYWATISTCLYEAAALPAPPAAILLAISGKAIRTATGDPLVAEHPHQRIQLTHHLPRFGDADGTGDNNTGAPQPCPIPVYLVDQRDVTAQTLRALTDDPVRTRASQNNTLADLRQAPRLILPG